MKEVRSISLPTAASAEVEQDASAGAAPYRDPFYVSLELMVVSFIDAALDLRDQQRG